MIDYIKKEPIISLAYFCLGIGGIVLAIFICNICGTYSISRNLTPEDMAQTGQIGDFMGGVIGSIWALAGVLLYFSALRLQTKELSNQSLSENENRYSEQIKQLENTFFNLLNIQQNIKQNITSKFRDIKYDGKGHFERSISTYGGNDFFEKMQRNLRFIYNFHNRETYILDDKKYLDEFSYPSEKISSQYVMENILTNDIIRDMNITKDIFEKTKAQKTEFDKCRAVYFYFLLYYEPYIGHYCRHLYNILKYIDTSKRDILRFICKTFEEKDRKQKIIDLNKRVRCYIAFLQSSLTTSELIILFYNSLVYDKSRKLYIKYRLLENLQDYVLFDKSHKTMVSGYTFKQAKDLADSIFKE